jgi:hypothetical protein
MHEQQITVSDQCKELANDQHITEDRMKYFVVLKSLYCDCGTCFKLPVLGAAYSLPAFGLSHVIFLCLPAISITILLSTYEF